MPESRCQCESQRMCSKARSPDISFESMRISASVRNGVVCARHKGPSGASSRQKKRKRDSLFFIKASCVDVQAFAVWSELVGLKNNTERAERVGSGQSKHFRFRILNLRLGKAIAYSTFYPEIECT